MVELVDVFGKLEDWQVYEYDNGVDQVVDNQYQQWIEELGKLFDVVGDLFVVEGGDLFYYFVYIFGLFVDLQYV